MIKSKKITVFLVLSMLITLLIVMTSCSVKVPDKYKNNWTKNKVFDSSCYKTIKIDKDELRILQLQTYILTTTTTKKSGRLN